MENIGWLETSAVEEAVVDREMMLSGVRHGGSDQLNLSVE